MRNIKPIEKIGGKIVRCSRRLPGKNQQFYSEEDHRDKGTYNFVIFFQWLMPLISGNPYKSHHTPPTNFGGSVMLLQVSHLLVAQINFLICDQYVQLPDIEPLLYYRGKNRAIKKWYRPICSPQIPVVMLLYQKEGDAPKKRGMHVKKNRQDVHYLNVVVGASDTRPVTNLFRYLNICTCLPLGWLHRLQSLTNVTLQRHLKVTWISFCKSTTGCCLGTECSLLPAPCDCAIGKLCK